MNLTLYFRLISIALFQRGLNKYDRTHFYCPPVHAKDGFSVSLQISYGNYCSSENGYRELGHTFDHVEFGFTSTHEPAMDEYAETEGDTTTTVGRIPTAIMEQVFANHGGIDWEKTISIEAFNKNVNNERN